MSLKIEYRYLETIDVLYATNTFQSSCVNVISHLDLLLRPERLDAVTSLEIGWPPTYTDFPYEYHLVNKNNGVQQILQMLANTFPRLEDLTLAVSERYGINKTIGSPRTFIEDLDGFAKTMVTLKDFAVVLTGHDYDKVWAEAHGVEQADLVASSSSSEGSADDGALNHFYLKFPCSGESTQSGDSTLNGCWIVRSKEKSNWAYKDMDSLE